MLDIIVLIGIAMSIFAGMKLGFIRTVYQLVSSLVAFVGALVISPAISQVLRVTPVYDFVHKNVMKLVPAIDETIGVQSQGSTIYEATEWLPDIISDWIVRNNNPEIYDLLGVNKLVDYIGTSIASMCITVLAVIIGWLLIKFLLGFAVSVLDLVAKLPLLRTANTLAGGAAGVVRGFVGVWLIGILVPFLTLIPSMSMVSQLIQDSVFVKYLYENNLLLELGMTYLVK